jgi:hypothetical protein
VVLDTPAVIPDCFRFRVAVVFFVLVFLVVGFLGDAGASAISPSIRSSAGSVVVALGGGDLREDFGGLVLTVLLRFPFVLDLLTGRNPTRFFLVLFVEDTNAMIVGSGMFG